MDAHVPPGAFTPTARSRIKRKPHRADYAHDSVYGILDAGIICHVGYVIDGQPYVTPTAYWRDEDRLYWHGSSASRMLRTQAPGVPACLTVAHFDGLVMARSGFNHSMNYRSVMCFGTARKVEDPDEKLAALEVFMLRIAPGRWDEVREPTTQEMKATLLLSMPVDEASAKVRTGAPADDEPDYALPCWAGVIGVRTVVEGILDDPRMPQGTPVPGYLRDYAPGAELGEVLRGLAVAQAESSGD